MQHSLSHWAQYLALRAFLGLLQCMPLALSSAVGAALGHCVATLPIRMNRIARRNLHKVYPEWSAQQVVRTQTLALAHLFRTATEFASIYAMPEHKIARIMEVEGAEILKEHKNPFYLSAHLGNWEFLNKAMGQLGQPMAIIYRAANNKLIDDYINNLRKETGGIQIPKGSKGARDLLHILKNELAPIAFLNDQKMNDGITAPFLGQQAKCAPALADLARKYNRAVIPVFCYRQSNGLKHKGFKVVVGQPLTLQHTENAEADILANTTLFNQVMEQAIHQSPEQWLWAHKRF